MRRRLIAACLVSFFSAEVKYSSHKMTLKTARGGKKKQNKKNKKLNMTQTQLTFYSNSYWTVCVKICILDNIIAAVLFICISSVNNKRSMLRFHSITPPITEGGLPVVFTTSSPGRFSLALGAGREKGYSVCFLLILFPISWWPFIFVSLCCI